MKSAKTRVALSIHRFRSPLAARLISGVTWSVGGSLFVSGLNLLIMLCVARALGREQYGQLILAQSTVNTIGSFAGFGVGATVTRYTAHLRNFETERLARIIRLSEYAILTIATLFFAATLLTADKLALHALNHSAFSAPLRMAAAAIFFSVVDGYQKSILLGFEAVRSLAFSSITGAILGAPVILLLAYRYGIIGAAGGLSGSSLIQALISKRQADRTLKRFGIPRRAPNCFSEWRVLRDFSLPALLSSSIVVTAGWVTQMMLARSAGGFGQVAILGVAMQWFNATLLIPNLAARVTLPMLTERLASNRSDHAMLILKSTVMAVTAVALPVAIIASIASNWIIAGYGHDFHAGTDAMVLAAWIAVLAVAAMPVGQILSAANSMWLGVAMNLTWATIYVGLSWKNVSMGAFGIVLSLGIAYLAHSTWVAAYGIRTLKHHSTHPIAGTAS